MRSVALLLTLTLFAAGAGSVSGADLRGVDYQLTDLVREGASVELAAYGSFAVRDDGMQGSAGCNLWYARSQPKPDGTIEFSGLSTTLIGCNDPGVSDAEDAFLAALHSMTTWSLDGPTLTLTNHDSSVRMIFTEQEPPVAPPLVGTVWVSHTWSDGENASSMAGGVLTIVLAADGTAGGSIACNEWSGTWAGGAPGPVTIEPETWTEIACASDVMDIERRFLELLAAGEATIEGIDLVISASDGTAIHLRKEP